MEPPDPRATVRAVVEAILPGPPHDPTPGALEAAADGYVLGLLQTMGPQAVGGVVMALDGFAQQVRADTPFHELDLQERSEVLRLIATHDLPDLQQLIRSLFSLTVAAAYGERGGLDAGGRLVARPEQWDHVGYPGPSTGYELGDA